MYLEAGITFGTVAPHTIPSSFSHVLRKAFLWFTEPVSPLLCAERLNSVRYFNHLSFCWWTRVVLQLFEVFSLSCPNEGSIRLIIYRKGVKRDIADVDPNSAPIASPLNSDFANGSDKRFNVPFFIFGSSRKQLCSKGENGVAPERWSIQTSLSFRKQQTSL